MRISDMAIVKFENFLSGILYNINIDFLKSLSDIQIKNFLRPKNISSDTKKKEIPKSYQVMILWAYATYIHPFFIHCIKCFVSDIVNLFLIS